eukprot:GHVT01053393.1.p1 GENE.GHVT01053393.1~~GHVT01053393.1.p1  ORF type:complete len:226 (+),score=4.21 GHVT01053393.1:861-1538(+)
MTRRTHTSASVAGTVPSPYDVSSSNLLCSCHDTRGSVASRLPIPPDPPVAATTLAVYCVTYQGVVIGCERCDMEVTANCPPPLKLNPIVFHVSDSPIDDPSTGCQTTHVGGPVKSSVPAIVKTMSAVLHLPSFIFWFADRRLAWRRFRRGRSASVKHNGLVASFGSLAEALKHSQNVYFICGGETPPKQCTPYQRAIPKRVKKVKTRRTRHSYHRRYQSAGMQNK